MKEKNSQRELEDIMKIAKEQMPEVFGIIKEYDLIEKVFNEADKAVQDYLNAVRPESVTSTSNKSFSDQLSLDKKGGDGELNDSRKKVNVQELISSE